MQIDISSRIISMLRGFRASTMYRSLQPKRDSFRKPATIFDDWGLQKFDADSRREVLDLIESCDRRASMLVASQLPVSVWHAVIGDTTIADVTVGRLVSYAHRVELQGGGSMRRIHGPPPLEES